MPHHNRPCTVDFTLSLYTFPNQRIITPSNRTVTLGDMHGNALKLFFLLCFHGCFEPAMYPDGQLEKLYLEFSELYDKKKEDFDIYCVERAVALTDQLFFRNDCSVRFIGDLLADRGNNDFLTLLLLKRMHVCAMPYTIILSNHDAEFFYAFESSVDNIPRMRRELAPGQFRSTDILVRLLEQKLLHTETVRTWLEKCVYPYVKFVDMEEQDDIITCYTHAPICQNNMRELHAYLTKQGLIDKTHFELTLHEVVGAINDVFAKIVSGSSIPRFFANRLSHNLLRHFLWVRFPDEEPENGKQPLQEETPKAVDDIFYVCGHDTKPEGLTTHQQWHSLDQYFGKSVKCIDEEKYAYYLSAGIQVSHSNVGKLMPLYKDIVFAPGQTHTPQLQELIRLVGLSIASYALRNFHDMQENQVAIKKILLNYNLQTELEQSIGNLISQLEKLIHITSEVDDADDMELVFDVSVSEADDSDASESDDDSGNKHFVYSIFNEAPRGDAALAEPPAKRVKI